MRGLNITRCQGPYNDSYTCPGLFDPPERTQCCLWDSQPAWCLPGGSSCSDSHVDKRNYCPGPSDGTELTQCCVWNSQPACCLPGGSSCRDSADTRSYCPGPDHGSERTHCCVWDKQPTCCLPGGSSCDVTHFRDYCPGPNDKKNDVSCCAEGYDKECCRWDVISGPLDWTKKSRKSVMTFSKFHQHSSLIFKHLNIVTLSDLVFLNIAVFMYKFHNRRLPSVFDTFFTQVNKRYNYNT